MSIFDSIPEQEERIERVIKGEQKQAIADWIAVKAGQYTQDSWNRYCRDYIDTIEEYQSSGFKVYLNDWEDYKYAINPRANWRNCISKTNLEWIMWEDENTIWIRNRSSYPSLFKYTGWSIWKDGKCEFGKLAISK